MPAHALVIDDEPDIRELLELTLSRMGLNSLSAATLAEARTLLRHHEFDICLCDMRLPDGDGVEFVRYLQSRYPELPVAVITAHGSMEAAVGAMKNGAFDFVSKPVDIQLLRRLVAQALASQPNAKAAEAGHERPADAVDVHAYPEQESSESAAASPAPAARKPHDAASSSPPAPAQGPLLIGESAPMVELRQLIAKVARTNAPVWIQGESGTGKELIARSIHAQGPRQDGPFVAVNCGAIPSELMESEFFGHLKGSFTGAHSDQDGLFRRAQGGTLFLDEVAELPLQMQVKLLRAIQERAVRPVGDSREHALDVRILSASHRDLGDEVQAGRFRHDLYYRLNVINLIAPPLRERRADIPLLVAHILERLQRRNRDTVKLELSDAAMDALKAHAFDGNVRELENILERASALRAHTIIEVTDLDLPALRSSAAPAERTAAVAANPLTAFEQHPSRSDSAAAVDRDRLLEVLNETRWNRKEAARRLGLSYRQLRYRIQQFGLDQAG